MIWLQQKLSWKSDWREDTLDIAHVVDQILWSILWLVGGAWAVTTDPAQLATFRQYGGQIFVTWAFISFGFSLLKWGMGKWLKPKAAL
jgi:hypothetical protein